MRASIVQERPLDLDIQEVTVLSRIEAKRYLTKEQRSIGYPWWLRSDEGFGGEHIYAQAVTPEGVTGIGYYIWDSIGVIPVLRISNLKDNNLKIGDAFDLCGHSWVVISDEFAWYDHIAFKAVFQSDNYLPGGNKYENSELKPKLENWALERGIYTTAQLEQMQGRA